MKPIISLLASAGLALGAVAAAPAAAQVEGKIATADRTRSLIGTTALQNAFQGGVVPVVERGAVQEVGCCQLHLVADGLAGDGVIADDNYFLHVGMDIQGDIKGGADAGVLHHSGQGFVLHAFQLQVIDPAKDDGSLGEEFLPVLQGEVEGIVV